MELTELVVDINDRLKTIFGIDTITGVPIWRIVFSDDQYEYRKGTYTDITPAGLYLRTVTEVRYVPKYKQWIDKKYVLERLVVVPEINAEALPTSKVSYEPIWTFEDKDGNYLPPKWEAAKFIIDTVYAAQYSNHNLRKYVDPEATQEEALAAKKKRVDDICESLWGEQSQFGDGIKSGETIMLTDNKSNGER